MRAPTFDTAARRTDPHGRRDKACLPCPCAGRVPGPAYVPIICNPWGLRRGAGLCRLDVTLVSEGLRVIEASAMTGKSSERAAADGWVLVVYTVPAQPTRKRAAVWRELKRLGALYLRDGVAVLPEVPAAVDALAALAERVLALDGQAVLVRGARLEPAVADRLRAELAAARAAEYADVAADADGLRRHLEREDAHHGLERAERTSLLADLTRLERWLDQVAARDYLHAGDPAPIAATLAGCRAVLEDRPAPPAPVATSGARR